MRISQKVAFALGFAISSRAGRDSRCLLLDALAISVLRLAFAGCSTPPARGILYPQAGVPAGESVVFGEITRASQVSHAFASVMDVQRSIPAMQQPVDGQRQPFYWHLPPGHDALFELGRGYGGGSHEAWSTRRVYAGFEVESAGQTIYLGGLSLTLHSNSVSASLSDDFANAVRTLQSRHPSVVGTPIKKLFQLENKR